MSRFSGITSGQPTQGIGAVPTLAEESAARVVPRPFSQPYSSPSQAQRDQAEMPADEGAEVPDAPAVSINPRDPYSAVRAAASAAWLSLSATELEVRKYFRTIAVPSGLEALAKMRKQCDLAAETLQQRMDEGNTERCSGCDKTLEEARKSQWIMQGSEVDSDTGVPMPYRSSTMWNWTPTWCAWCSSWFPRPRSWKGQNPRVDFIFEDARRFLTKNKSRYDVILHEPPGTGQRPAEPLSHPGVFRDRGPAPGTRRRLQFQPGRGRSQSSSARCGPATWPSPTTP